MRGSIQRCLMGWLALCAAVLLGVAPSRGLVLCFEPDGTIAFEGVGQVLPCEGRDAVATDVATDEEAPSRVVAPVSQCCQCLDIPVEGTGDEARVPPAEHERSVAAPLVLEAGTPCSPCASMQERVSRWSGAPPGSAGALAQLRTVVLRV